MQPFDKQYYTEKVQEYCLKIKEERLGNFYIDKVIKKFHDGYLYKANDEVEIQVAELREGEKLWMRISPHEVQGCFEAIKRAEKKVGVVGLGLGYFVQEVLKKDSVDEIIVYEINPEVIELYKRNFGPNKKLTIVEGDAFKAERENFDFFFVDIYQYKVSLDVVSDYIAFNKLHEIKEYAFWGMEHFLLSCSIEDIIWVYIPENWMEMAKDLFERFNDSPYIDYFSPIDSDETKSILDEFSKVL
ncbi:hypothetical protein CPJCM30710_21140 [Clostridium polyendosporum]|uniref:Uncharacterized protein n=1 Tax=Clostridium polyendosporum TaxID=69208 RepID=A0A919VMC3_9CLOT|nr:hypothetical protein [Clostridium polyendosporum]GIM29448.1 hypothetical protein CPJCM30710_21140 [Clostridium polyendosporum]